MKFIVDEMPRTPDECPFHRFGPNRNHICTCPFDHLCEYFNFGRKTEWCDWLKIEGEE